MFRRMAVYGKNTIVVTVKPIWMLLFLEVISPFYVFQIFSVTVWYNDHYIYYASVIIIMSVASIVANVYQIRKTETALRDMVHSIDMVRYLRFSGYGILRCLGYGMFKVTVVRNGEPTDMLSDGLVPGDLIHIPKHGCVLQCDAVLLAGTC